jgi:phosphoribosylformimino-5-aminoimidazole carboxamide ribotide isomerase
VFSLDLRDGKPLREWPTASGRPWPIWRPAFIAVGFGIDRVIVLDLARVGGGTGTGTENLCREIAANFRDVEVIAGGGISGPEDLKRLEACGVKGVLVASALHDGRFKPDTRHKTQDTR